MSLLDVSLLACSSPTLFAAQVNPLLAIPLLGAAGVAGVHRHVLRLWAKLEDLIIWFKSLMKDMKDKIDDAVHALLLKFSAPYEQSEWCVHLEVESPEVLQGLLDGSVQDLPEATGA